MAWSPNTPRKTGIDTLRLLARQSCRLLTKFTPTIKTYLDPAKHIYVDALNKACADFVENVPNPNNSGT